MEEKPVFISIRAMAKKSFRRNALKVFMIIQALMMQIPSAKSKGRDHVKILSQRLELW